MANILVVLPYSGRHFGGGLAVFNQELSKAFRDAGHSVKLLTLDITASKLARSINPDAGEHGAEVIAVNVEPLSFQDPSVTDSERESLYRIINSKETLLGAKEHYLPRITKGDWQPDIIVGHSRFSGPAALILRNEFFHEARVQYFLHSYPVEGTVLVGHGAYNERIDLEKAETKLRAEADSIRSMKQTDVIVAVGPFLRAGALKLLERAGNPKVRVHECIGGAAREHMVDKLVPPDTGCPFQLLFNGRANAPIKGFEDILLSAQQLRDRDTCPPIAIDVRYWGTKTYYDDKPAVDVGDVQEFVDDILRKEGRIGKAVVNVRKGTSKIMDLVRQSHGVLMPSYIEHFGLVPMEALSAGVPVLANEVSGAAMFLRRFEEGRQCIVEDFHQRVDPRHPDAFLSPVDVPRDAFDQRPGRWADAIEALVENLPARFESARALGERLQETYTWEDCAKGIVSATGVAYEKHPVTQQGPNGCVWDENGDDAT